jgi:hypothetical protein
MRTIANQAELPFENYESGGQEFESLRARHFGIRYRRQMPPISRSTSLQAIGRSRSTGRGAFAFWNTLSPPNAVDFARRTGAFTFLAV